MKLYPCDDDQIYSKSSEINQIRNFDCVGGREKNRIQLEWWLESYKVLHGLAEFGLRGGGYYIHDFKLRNHVDLHANWWLKGKVMDS